MNQLVIIIRAHCCALLAVAGAAAIIGGIVIGGLKSIDLVLGGLTIAMVALTRVMIWPALRPQIDLYSSAYDEGYGRGVYDERQRTHPVLVRLRVPDDARELTDD